MFVAILLIDTSTGRADLLRLVSRIPSGQTDTRHVSSFPENPVLEYQGPLDGWMAGSIITAGRWRGNAESTLREFLRSHRLDANSPCNVFLAKALKLLFGIADFEFPGLPAQFLGANDIARYVAAHPEQWMLLGPASSQIALERAQTYANLNTPVIAVYTSAPHGHVAVVLPGSLQYSGQWNLHTPNSASVFLNRPHKSYVGLTLSNAFQASDLSRVKIYTRNSAS